jgi:hypothetical protein
MKCSSRQPQLEFENHKYNLKGNYTMLMIEQHFFPLSVVLLALIAMTDFQS